MNSKPILVLDASALLALIDFDQDLAVAAGKMKKQTAKLGLSVGDRACLALAARLDAPAITADSAWKKIKGIKIHAIR